MMKLIARFPGIVVVDEAYIDFSRQESMAALAGQYPTLVVLQTFSKAFGLAGICLGAATPTAMVISYLMREKSPYNVRMRTAGTGTTAVGKSALLTFNTTDG